MLHTGSEMAEFSTEFIQAIEEHCVGKTIVRVEADGSFEDQKEHWVHLEDGTKFTFVVGGSGSDSDCVYGLKITGTTQGSTVSLRRYPPSGYDAVHSPLVVVEPTTAPMRSGFSRACGQKITSAYFAADAIGVCLDAQNYLVSSTAGYILYATWLYEPTTDQEYQAVAKTITGEWSYGAGFGLSNSEQDKLC